MSEDMDWPIPPSAPNRTFRTETTLSLAMNPEISDVQIRQSPSPAGRKRGTRKLAIAARMLV